MYSDPIYFMPYTLTRNAAGGNPALTANRTYEARRDALHSIENSAGTTLVSSYTYNVNAIGQRGSVTTAGTAFAGTQANWTWGYDALGQAVKADSNTTAHDRAYQYDTIGNRKRFAHGTLNLPTSDNYTATLLNQYTVVPTYTPQPAHDLDGNLTRGPIPGGNGNVPGVQPPADATDIKWDAENRMVSCIISDVNYLYNYDHLSRLTSQLISFSWGGPFVSRIYHYDGWNRIAEFTGTTTLSDTFTWGLDLSGTMQGAGGVGGLLATRWVSSNNSDYFPTYDGNGNISEYLTSAGAVEAHYEYDPFGTLTRLTGNNSTRFQYRFSTKPRDFNTGLYYYGYRWYDPVTGRWPSRDPIDEIGGVNLYVFADGSPTFRTDLLGLSSQSWKDRFPSIREKCCGEYNELNLRFYDKSVYGNEKVLRDLPRISIENGVANTTTVATGSIDDVIDNINGIAKCDCISTLIIVAHGSDRRSGGFKFDGGRGGAARDGDDAYVFGSLIKQYLCPLSKIMLISCGGGGLDGEFAHGLALTTGVDVTASTETCDLISRAKGEDGKSFPGGARGTFDTYPGTGAPKYPYAGGLPPPPPPEYWD